ncbi:DUF1772 domain-containing protein [Salinisphaera sp. T31B1]|uniref:DUF1772 domain-containing protein n=1 Tax=Salinisphaera sp. T31B1 TaxID=727963 RepID=UPI0033409D2A
MFFGILAVLCAGFFAGAAAYISLVQQPAARTLGTAGAVRFFGPMYARAAPFQASLALIGTLSALVSCSLGNGWLWLIGAVCLVAVVPFTLVVIKPTNDRLKDPGLDGSSEEANRLLGRWSGLHALRIGASIVAFVIFVIALARI